MSKKLAEKKISELFEEVDKKFIESIVNIESDLDPTYMLEWFKKRQKQWAIAVIKDMALTAGINLHEKYWDLGTILMKGNEKEYKNHCKKEVYKRLISIFIDRFEIKENELK